jgi:hypothetical protein
VGFFIIQGRHALNGLIDYDDYYASLAAGTQSRSTPTSGVPDDYSRDEEVDVKPNVQLLDSLGDYRKRARSPSTHEDEPPAKKFSQDSGPAPTATPTGELEVAQESEDDPTVYGRPYFSFVQASLLTVGHSE